MPIRSILVATDCQLPSLRAVSFAFDLAAKIGAVVHLLRVYEPLVVPTSSGSGYIPHDSLHREALASLERLSTPHRGSETLGRHIAIMGDPTRTILQTAEELKVDLLVLGTHGRRGIKRLLAGSVSESVMREAHCPVVVARSGEPELLVEGSRL